MNESESLFHNLSSTSPKDDLIARISRLRALALTLDSQEAAARMTDYLLGLEVQLLETT